MKSFFFFLVCQTFMGISFVKAIYLTLPEDPCHNMQVHWIEKQGRGACATFWYQKKGDADWKEAKTFLEEDLRKSSYFIRHAFLDNLEEDSEYVFYLDDGKKKTHRFHTLPEHLEKPLKIAIGGDIAESFSLYQKMNRVVREKNPDFVILQGDLAYACGKGLWNPKHGKTDRWISFFSIWYQMMQDKDGRILPIVPLLGNHDITGQDRREKGENALFCKFFPFKEGVSYRNLVLGDYATFFLLDTGHLASIEGAQTAWLAKKLEECSPFLWKIPVYHIAAYPSVYHPNNRESQKIRSFWSPLFERYGVRVAFESHNHAFKRTCPIADEKIALHGVVYIGDGGWGASPRKRDFYKAKEDFFYLAKHEMSTCFSLLILEKKKIQVECYNHKNVLLDQWDAFK